MLQPLSCDRPILLLVNEDRATEFGRLYGRNGPGYVYSFLFMSYLYNRFGGEKLLRKLLESPRSGWDNVLDAIHELIGEGNLAIPATLINQASILRHFGAALWLNNAYIAKYSLFFIAPEYEPLGDENSPRPKCNGQSVSTFSPLNGESRIEFCKNPSTRAREVYGLTKKQAPANIQPLSSRSFDVVMSIEY